MSFPKIKHSKDPKRLSPVNDIERMPCLCAKTTRVLSFFLISAPVADNDPCQDHQRKRSLTTLATCFIMCCSSTRLPTAALAQTTTLGRSLRREIHVKKAKLSVTGDDDSSGANPMLGTWNCCSVEPLWGAEMARRVVWGRLFTSTCYEQESD